MSVRDDKEKIIREIMELRTMIDNIAIARKKDDICLENTEKTQSQLNKIHNMVFNI